MTAALAYVDDNTVSTCSDNEPRKVVSTYIWPGAPGAMVARESPSTTTTHYLVRDALALYPMLRYDLAHLGQVGVVGVEVKTYRASEFALRSYSALIADF